METQPLAAVMNCALPILIQSGCKLENRASKISSIAVFEHHPNLGRCDLICHPCAARDDNRLSRGQSFNKDA
jgi:hypothetical protein